MYYLCMYYVCITGTGATSSRVATVTVNGLMCEVEYTITAGGTLNGQLVGPRIFLGNVTTGSCPEICFIISTYVHKTV